MSGTPHTPSTNLVRLSKEKIDEQLERIVQSETFRHAIALQRLLGYLGLKALETPPAEVKEYTIGVEVFGRGRDYDPKIDTSVRVQIHRLRLKLNEYYETEGNDDQILVELHKGRYLPTFKFRTSAVVEQGQAASVGWFASWLPSWLPGLGGLNPTGESNEGDAHAGRPRRSAFWSAQAAVSSLGILLFALGILLGIHWEKIAIPGRGDSSRVLAGTLGVAADNPAQSFWASFLGSDGAPVIGFANSVYLSDRPGDLFVFRRGASDNRGTPVEPHVAKEFAPNPELVEMAGPLYYEDGYTGTGDVESAVTLTRLFTQMGLQVTVKRCRMVTIDDLREHSVILLGSPAHNDAVAQLPQDLDFVFQSGNPPGSWGGRFVNVHPQPGESPWYKVERDPTTQQLVTDYGVITIQPGVVPGRYIAILAAQDTSGVAADAQFMASPTQVAELTARLKALGGKIGAGVPPTFQALLRVDVEKGIDVLSVKLIAVHLIHPGGEALPRPPESNRPAN